MFEKYSIAGPKIIEQESCPCPPAAVTPRKAGPIPEKYKESTLLAEMWVSQFRNCEHRRAVTPTHLSSGSMGKGVITPTHQGLRQIGEPSLPPTNYNTWESRPYTLTGWGLAPPLAQHCREQTSQGNAGERTLVVKIEASWQID